MNMLVQVKEINEIPRPVLPHKSGMEKVLLESFLFDARNSINDYLKEISKAANNETTPTGYSSNQVDVNFYPDHAFIEHLYINDNSEMDGENFASTEIPLSEAKQLLLEWQAALDKWYAEHPA